MTEVVTNILRRAISLSPLDLRPETARALAGLRLQAEDHARYDALSLKAQDGTLTAAESDELTGLIEADDVLSLIRLRAERELRTLGGAA